MSFKYRAVRNWQLRSGERGVGLLIAISVLVIVLAFGAMLMFLAGSESTSVGRQRYSTPLTYAAQAGLEEARSRMLRYHPQAFSNLTPPVQLPTAVGQVVYIVNPVAGEAVNPLDLSSTNVYADNEYANEFGTPITAATVAPFVASIQSTLTAAPPIPFKWARITLKTELSAKTDIDGNGNIDNTIPIFFDGKRQNRFTGLRQWRSVRIGEPGFCKLSLPESWVDLTTHLLPVEVARPMQAGPYTASAGIFFVIHRWIWWAP
jgi:hypothetical protein